MILLTGLYQDSDLRRRSEFLECIRRNVENDRIDEIHIFLEDPIEPNDLITAYPLIAAAKINLIRHGKRLTYQDLFGYANQHLVGCSVIIANSDIFFDHTLARLDGYDLSGKLLCLSRWNVQSDGSITFFDHPASQDAWIFRAPIREFFCNFHMGIPGCDNRLAWEAEQVGLAISNPGRSLRAHHLHLTQIWRYSQNQRLAGPTKVIPAEFIGIPWLWFVVPCMGRLDDLRQSIGSLVAQPRSSYVLVDYSCPDDAGRWTRENYPNVIVVKVYERIRFKGAEARNHGAAAVDDDGIICFLDADMVVSPSLSEYILSCFEEGNFLVPDRQGPGYETVLICSKTAFNHVHGFDETFLDWGEECADLKSALLRSGVTERRFPASLISHRGHQDLVARNLGVIQDQETNRSIHKAYRRAKSAVLDEIGANGVSGTALWEIYRAITRRYLNERRLTLDLSCAVVTFHETMGYTIARLEIGISSHVNDLRRFTIIPESLIGRQFTQVVAFSVSPIEVEFLSPGKLFVLVGNDWEGYYVATAWLLKNGYKEWLPSAETQRGTTFEVWSLIGDAGDRTILPTQVMLVADRLVRK